MNLTPTSPRTRQLIPLTKLIRRPDARLAVAAQRADLQDRLRLDPNDYDALVELGEIELRVGLGPAAQALLYRASLLPPPSWEAFQRTALLLRRAEENGRHGFHRPAGAPPPLMGVFRRLFTTLASAFRRRPSNV